MSFKYRNLVLNSKICMKYILAYFMQLLLFRTRFLDLNEINLICLTNQISSFYLTPISEVDLDDSPVDGLLGGR